ncbi:MAG: HAMP domain-containing protein [Algicola sp.]|nr:HAMP domain-containing protein [Algicola sp.]
MKNLFLRLYLLLIVAFLGIGWSLDQFVDSFEADQNITSDLDIHKGTFFLLNKELMRLPEQEQDGYLQAIGSSFGFPISLSGAKPLNISPQQHQHLEDGGVVSVYDDAQGSSWFYQQLSNADKVIVIGPVQYQTKSSPLWSIVFFVFIALVVFIWVWPIAKGLRELTRAATAFGTGDFTVRAKMSSTAPLIDLVERFNAMAQRIQRLVESHKELSHGVSHELRTPIARLRFAMEMVREVDEQAQRVKYLDTMDTNIEELDGLVDELLVYARFDREEPNLDIANHDLAEVIADQLARFQETEPQLDIEFIPSPDLTIKIDRAAICRVVDNLVRNAVRYAESKITVSYELVNDQDNAHVKIKIDDDGPGIPEQSRVELFKPFVRLDQSRDRKSGGIGLGLAIVKRLVELHHGSVWACANDDGGARFVVSLPL